MIEDELRRETLARKQAEGQLRYQASLLDNVSDAIISTDINFIIRSWNRAAETIYGWRADEAIGKAMEIVVPTENLDADLVRRFMQLGQWSGQVTQLAKDGSKRSILSSVVLLYDESGQPSGAVAVNCDITEQVKAVRAEQASQQLMLATLNSLSAIICVLDESGTIIAVNNLWRNFASANGGVTERVCEGINYLQVCAAAKGEAQEDALAFAAGIRAVANGDDDYFEYEYPCHAPQERRWFIGRVTPLIGSSTDVRRVVVAHENITAIKQLEAENEQLSAQFYQAQKMESLGRLAGGIAHDFNNLLVPIMGYCELAIRQLTPESQLRSHLARIKEAGERAVSLTRQILTFSRQQVLEMKILDLNQVTYGFEPMLRRLIGEDITLQLRLSSESLPIMGDWGQLEQVMLNLVVNARDAMPDGGMLMIETDSVVLDVAYVGQYSEMEPGTYALLAVSDTGYGMNAATQQRIFEPFFTTKPQGLGTGLGLATVFGIVKQHGGHILVYSELDQGTSFKVYLPLSKKTISTTNRAESDAELLDGTETVLLVEDEDNVRHLVSDVLRIHGYKVLEAEDPEQALILAEKHAGTIRLLLTDVIMPKMNGRKLYQKLSSTLTGLKVLYMSGYTDNIIAPHDTLAVESAFLQKPFTIDALLHKLRAILG